MKNETKISIVDVEPQMVLGMKREGSYDKIPIMVPALYTYAASKNVAITGEPIFVCHEYPNEAKIADENANCEIEICCPIGSGDNVEETEDIKMYELDGGRMAKIIHKGPYEECAHSYEKLFKWIKKKGLKITGPTREVYLNGPNDVLKEELLTEIYAPVE